MAAGDKFLLDSDLTDKILLDSDLTDVLLIEAAAAAAKGLGPYTRHAQHGGIRMLYGSFAGKEAATGGVAPMAYHHRHHNLAG
jgi:hypothetical protein